jgi:tetratricopeptide (TPR) repeat protein
VTKLWSRSPPSSLRRGRAWRWRRNGYRDVDAGREREALAEWQKAVDAQPDNAAWRFRYGKLLVTNQMNEPGREHLKRAIAWAEKEEAPPRWLWEAHHFMARSLHGLPEAASHWEQFLRLGPRDSPYRAEAKQALAKLGKPWSGE